MITKYDRTGGKGVRKKTEKMPGGHLLFVLAVVCALALLVMAWALLRDTGADGAAFTPPPFEENAQQGEPEVPQELGYSFLNAQEYEVGICGAPVVKNGSAVLYMTNPASNKVWLKVRILDESGQMLGESGLLKPGEYVEAVELTSMPEEDIAVVLKIMAYEPDTYYSAGAASLSTTLHIDA
ncbi:hypothetical protein SAMN05660368_00925 [Marvinbryantia formatexigens]|nr:hypothetical protein SAMN05660368_00925 [Marvinbryantia formatexigens]